MKKILMILFLGFLVLGLVFNFPMILANDGPHGNSKVTGSAVNEDDRNKPNAPTLYAKQKIRTQINSDGRIRIRDKDGEEIESEVELEGDEEDLRALTSDGKSHRIRINPEEAKLRVREKWKGNINISNISLEEVRYRNIPRVVWQVEHNTHGRFLGIFKIALRAQSEVDPNTGEILATNLPWWAFMLTGLEIPGDLPGKDDDSETTNNAPIINSDPVTSVNESSEYSYQVEATDADTNDTLTYSLTQNPGWLSINSSMGLIEGISPFVDNDTIYEVSIEVSDGTDSGMQTYNLTVMNVTA